MAENSSITVPVERWGEYQKRYTAKVAREVRTGAMRTAAPVMVAMLGVETLKRGIFDLGGFSNKWRFKLIQANTALRISNATAYGYNIEAGRRPGARPPPVRVGGKLHKWVRRRLGINDYMMARKVAFFIARKISRRGIRRRRVLLDPKFQQVLAGVLLQYIDKAFLARDKL
jgi:hypothetical protein